MPAVMKGPLHLAWQYVAHYRVRTLLLSLALGLTLALPLAVRGLVQIAQTEMRSRAVATPWCWVQRAARWNWCSMPSIFAEGARGRSLRNKCR